LRVGLPERLNTVRRLPQGDGADARVVGAGHVDHVDDLLEEPQRDAPPPRHVAVTHVSLDGHARGLLKRHDVIEQVEEPVHTNLADSPLSQREPQTSTVGPVSSHGGLRATPARHPRDTPLRRRAFAPRSPSLRYCALTPATGCTRSAVSGGCPIGSRGGPAPSHWPA
jgi:hypothetical protein